MLRFRMAISASLIIATASCSKSSGSKDSAIDDEPYVAPSGEEALQFMAPALAVQPVPVDALMKALSIAEAEGDGSGAQLLDESGGVSEADSKAIDLLKAGAKAKESIDTTLFPNAAEGVYSPGEPKPKEASLALLDDALSTPPKINVNPYSEKPFPENDPVALDDASWNGAKEIVISRLTQIPVKHQGSRGTCGTFTGVGQLEYMVLKKHHSKLTTVDLSEQRFYMMARPDLVEKGGGVTNQDAGSAWFVGYGTSLGQYGTVPPSNDPKYNIPLESDCPYQSTIGANELQINQMASCRRGAVRVTSMSDTFSQYEKVGNEYKIAYFSSTPRTAQEIFDYIKTHDMPYPTAIVIDNAWSYNDGIITYASDKNPTNVRGPHGVLLVGMRKLDESKYPNEGGMCFITKNSWGEGWGVNGYSCMTLAWFNKYRDTYPYGLAFDVDVDIDYLVSQSKMTVPSKLLPNSKELEASSQLLAVNPIPVNPGLAKIAQADADPSLGTDPVVPPVITPDVDNGANQGEEEAPTSDTNTDTGADPKPNTDTVVDTATVTADGFTIGALVGSAGSLSKALYKIDGDIIQIKGILKGDNDVTHPLSLPFEAGSGAISFDDPSRGLKQVGTFTNGRINICYETFSEVCSLNYVAEENTLVVGLTEAEFRKHEADPDADFITLADFLGYGVDFALANESYADFRLRLGGATTNALRLKIDALSGAISYKQREIGNYQKAQLCSGDFRKLCRFVVNAEDKTLNIFFKTTK